MSQELKAALNGNRPLTRADQLKSVLLQSKRQITSLLEDETKANKFLAASLVVANDPALRNCSPDSIVQSLIGVAMANLSVDKNLGQAYLIGYKDTCTLQLGYKGWIQLLFRAGWLVKAFPVFDCDEFSMAWDGWDNRVQFTPNLDDRDEGDSAWAYAHLRGIFVIARNSDTKDEYSVFVAKKVIEKLRLVSPNQRGATTPQAIWKDWYIEMAIGKAVKKLAKMLPVGDTRQVVTALAVDDKTEIGKKIDYSSTIESGVVTEINEPVRQPEPQPEGTLDEATGEISYPEEELPLVAEPSKPEPQAQAQAQAKPDPYALGKVLKAISDAKTQAELEAIHVAIAELDNDAGRTAKSAFTKRSSALKKAPPPAKPTERDWVLEINACTQKEALLNLIEEMHDGDQQRHRQLLDEQLDYLRD
jgi:recombination protein RecT